MRPRTSYQTTHSPFVKSALPKSALPKSALVTPALLKSACALFLCVFLLPAFTSASGVLGHVTNAKATVGHSNTVALSNGLVGYWTFDGKTVHWNTGKIDDVSGNGNTGQMIGMSTSTSVVIGKIGQALSFNGKAYGSGQSEVQVASSSSLFFPAGSSFSVSAWIKPHNTVSPSQMIYLSSGTESQHHWELILDPSNRFRFGQYVPNYSLNSSFVVPNGTWHQVVATYNYPSNTLTLYGDGTFLVTGNPGVTLYGGSGLRYLGVDIQQQDDPPFSGAMDDVRIYNRALSPQEVAQLYALAQANIAHSNTSSNIGINSGLVGYWTFDGKQTHWDTGKVDDVSGNGNTGQMVGMSTSTAAVVGKIGQALNFNGSDYIDVPYAANQFNLSGNFTFVAWVKEASLAGYQVIADNIWSVQNGGFQDAINAGAALDCGASNSTGYNLAGYSYTFKVGVWYQIACVTANGSPYALTTDYVDGVNIGSQGIHSVTNPTVDTFIGAGNGGGNPTRNFVGTIDDVRLYNRALSPQEIAQLYAMGK